MYRTIPAIALTLAACGNNSPHGQDSLQLSRSGSDYDRHVDALRVPRGFTIIEEPPFVVIGNEPPDRVAEHARGTVRWAVKLLKKDYFERDPDEVIDVWLFGDDDSYRSYARSLFDDEPTTPFGYYSRAHQALIMNISTGGGTLVHEIVHPFIRANFPDCPVWFNEGMASLYEQSGEEDGHIRGYLNWRLPGLQSAIRGRQLPSFRELMALDQETFYADSRGHYYGQARYLLYYLQERGLLRRYYHAFRARRADDPTGYQTFLDVLAIDDPGEFQALWEQWVLGLE